MARDFFVKNDVAFGTGAVEKLPNILQEYRAQNVMVIHGRSVKKAGIAERVLEQVKKVNVRITIFEGVVPNPTNEAVETVAALARKEKIDVFIAIGGGSCIDLAKAANILMTNPGPIKQYGGNGKVVRPVLPLIAIPTTAGSSSEITNVVALIDTKEICKYVVIDNKIVPSKVIAEPEFTKTMPASVTAATGMDAITHAVESYISNMATSLTEYHALKGLQLFYENLPRVVEDGTDMSAREGMMLGCIITGFSFSNANLGLVHGIAHALGAHFHLPHGMANAAVLPYVMQYNADSCPEKMSVMAKVLGLPVTGETRKDQFLIAEELLVLSQRLGIKTLSELGITREDFAMLAEDILKEPVLAFNPKQGITREDILTILEKAY